MHLEADISRWLCFHFSRKKIMIRICETPNVLVRICCKYNRVFFDLCAYSIYCFISNRYCQTSWCRLPKDSDMGFIIEEVSGRIHYHMMYCTSRWAYCVFSMNYILTLIINFKFSQSKACAFPIYPLRMLHLCLVEYLYGVMCKQLTDAVTMIRNLF